MGSHTEAIDQKNIEEKDKRIPKMDPGASSSGTKALATDEKIRHPNQDPYPKRGSSPIPKRYSSPTAKQGSSPILNAVGKVKKKRPSLRNCFKSKGDDYRDSEEEDNSSEGYITSLPYDATSGELYQESIDYLHSGDAYKIPVGSSATKGLRKVKTDQEKTPDTQEEREILQKAKGKQPMEAVSESDAEADAMRARVRVLVNKFCYALGEFIQLVSTSPALVKMLEDHRKALLRKKDKLGGISESNHALSRIIRVLEQHNPCTQEDNPYIRENLIRDKKVHEQGERFIEKFFEDAARLEYLSRHLREPKEGELVKLEPLVDRCDEGVEQMDGMIDKIRVEVQRLREENQTRMEARMTQHNRRVAGRNENTDSLLGLSWTLLPDEEGCNCCRVT